MKWGRYASRTRYCELYINEDYKGIYVFMEKIKRDSNRVNISKLNPDEINDDDVTGGYILKFDWSFPLDLRGRFEWDWCHWIGADVLFPTTIWRLVEDRTSLRYR